MEKMVKCKACGTDIAKSAKTCPNCGAKQKKHTAMIAICAFLVFCVAVAALDGENESQQVGTISSSKTPSSTEESSTERSDISHDKIQTGEDTSQNNYEAGSNTEVSYEAELVLMQITEDMAKQVAQNPGTVEFKTLCWGFAREGTNYAVQGTFECSNLLGVTEEHDIQVWCEASSDYSKIQPYAVYLDGEQIA